MDVLRGQSIWTQNYPVPGPPRRGQCFLPARGFRQAAAQRGRSSRGRASDWMSSSSFWFRSSSKICCRSTWSAFSRDVLFALCVESAFSGYVSVKVSLVDFVRIIKCHGDLAIRLRSPHADSSGFGSQSSPGSTSVLRSLPPVKPWGSLGTAFAAIFTDKMHIDPPPPIEPRMALERRCGPEVITF